MDNRNKKDIIHLIDKPYPSNNNNSTTIKQQPQQKAPSTLPELDLNELAHGKALIALADVNLNYGNAQDIHKLIEKLNTAISLISNTNDPFRDALHALFVVLSETETEVAPGQHPSLKVKMEQRDILKQRATQIHAAVNKAFNSLNNNEHPSEKEALLKTLLTQLEYLIEDAKKATVTQQKAQATNNNNNANNNSNTNNTSTTSTNQQQQTSHALPDLSKEKYLAALLVLKKSSATSHYKDVTTITKLITTLNDAIKKISDTNDPFQKALSDLLDALPKIDAGTNRSKMDITPVKQHIIIQRATQIKTALEAANQKNTEEPKYLQPFISQLEYLIIDAANAAQTAQQSAHNSNNNNNANNNSNSSSKRLLTEENTDDEEEDDTQSNAEPAPKLPLSDEDEKVLKVLNKFEVGLFDDAKTACTNFLNVLRNALSNVHGCKLGNKVNEVLNLHKPETSLILQKIRELMVVILTLKNDHGLDDSKTPILGQLKLLIMKVEEYYKEEQKKQQQQNSQSSKNDGNDDNDSSVSLDDDNTDNSNTAGSHPSVPLDSTETSRTSTESIAPAAKKRKTTLSTGMFISHGNRERERRFERRLEDMIRQGEENVIVKSLYEQISRANTILELQKLAKKLNQIEKDIQEHHVDNKDNKRFNEHVQKFLHSELPKLRQACGERRNLIRAKKTTISSIEKPEYANDDASVAKLVGKFAGNSQSNSKAAGSISTNTTDHVMNLTDIRNINKDKKYLVVPPSEKLEGDKTVLVQHKTETDYYTDLHLDAAEIARLKAVKPDDWVGALSHVPGKVVRDWAADKVNRYFDYIENHERRPDPAPNAAASTTPKIDKNKFVLRCPADQFSDDIVKALILAAYRRNPDVKVTLIPARHHINPARLHRDHQEAFDNAVTKSTGILSKRKLDAVLNDEKTGVAVEPTVKISRSSSQLFGGENNSSSPKVRRPDQGRSQRNGK